MANKTNGEKKKGRGACLVNKTDMDRATRYAHGLGFKVTGFEFSRGKIGISVEDSAGAASVLAMPSDDSDLDKAIEQDDGH